MGLILGIDIGGTDTKLGIITPDGDIVERDRIPTRAKEGPEAVARRVQGWLEEREEKHHRINVAGVGCAGLIDGVAGHLYVSPNLPGWKDIPLKRIFSTTLSLSVIVENDVNAAAYAEYLKGAGKGTRHFICITLGTGVGGGLIIDGKLHRGMHGFAGEVGHMIIQIDGPQCTCGRRGCLESLVKADAIKARATEAIHAGRESSLKDIDGFEVKDIAEEALNGDGLSIEVLAETGRLLGIGLTNLIHIFNPEVIAIGGGIAGAGDFILDPAYEAVRENLMDNALSDVRIVPAELGNSASFLGAALLAAASEGTASG